MAAAAPAAAPSVGDFRAFVGALEPLFTIATAALGFLIYLEAQRIRRMEWYAKSSEHWQDFNRLVLETGMDERWSDIRHGRRAWPAIDQRDLMLIYAFLNVLAFEFKAHRTGLLWRAYADKSVGDNLGYFRHIWPQLSAHLRGDGWPDDFMAAAERTMRRLPPLPASP